MRRQPLLVLPLVFALSACFGGARGGRMDPRIGSRAVIGVLGFQDLGKKGVAPAEPWVEAVALERLRAAGYDAKGGLGASTGADELVEAFRLSGVGLADPIGSVGAEKRLAAGARHFSAAARLDAVLVVREIPMLAPGPGGAYLEVAILDGGSGNVLWQGRFSKRVREEALMSALATLPKHTAPPAPPPTPSPTPSPPPTPVVEATPVATATAAVAIATPAPSPTPAIDATSGATSVAPTTTPSPTPVPSPPPAVTATPVTLATPAPVPTPVRQTTLFGIPVADGELSGTVGLALGRKLPTNAHWEGIDYEDTFGIEGTLGHGTWPVALDARAFHNYRARRVDGGVFRKATEETLLGVRWVHRSGIYKIHVGAGGELARLYTHVEDEDGTKVRTRGRSVAAWTSAGVTAGAGRLIMGLSVRYVADLGAYEGTRVGADGFHGTLTVGLAFGGP